MAPDTQVEQTATAKRTWGLVVPTLALFALLVCLLFSPLLRSAIIMYSVSEQRLPWSIRAYRALMLWHAGTSVLLPAGDPTAPHTDPAAPDHTRVRTFFPIGKGDPPVILLAHGLAGRGIDDPLLVFVGKRLAEGGYRVLLPEMRSNADLRMREDALESIGATIAWAASTYHQKVTVVAVSFAGGLALTAATQPRLADDLKMVLVVSGYNDLPRLADYYLGRPALDPAGHAYQGPPPSLGPMLIAYQHLEELVPAEDAVPLRRSMAAKYNDPYGEPTGAAALTNLTPRQRSEYVELCLSPSPATKAAILAMVQRHAAEWQALSPFGKLAHLQVPVYLIHGTHDPVVPLGEAGWTVGELPPTNPAHLLVSKAMLHVVLDDHAPRLERIRVGLFLADVLTKAGQ